MKTTKLVARDIQEPYPLYMIDKLLSIKYQSINHSQYSQKKKIRRLVRSMLFAIELSGIQSLLFR